MILMNAIKGAVGTTEPSTLLAMGLLGGLAISASAWLQGKVGAVAADTMGETGKGFGIFIMVVGIIETVALLGLVFFMQAIR
jgi:V/A-type H+-transporting ATPase subunit K